MSPTKKGRFSWLLKPFSHLIDLSIISFSIFLFEINLNHVYLFVIYAVIFWEAISFFNEFYEVQRHTRLLQIVTLLFRQFVLLAFALYAYIGFFKQPDISRLALGEYILSVFALVSFFKILLFFLLNRYRAVLGGNLRNVVVLGNTEKTRQLIKIFNTKLHFGYSFKKQFDVNDADFSLKKCFDYIIDNNINEVYFSVASLSNKQINKLIDFADNNLRELKFIPDNKDIYSKRLKYEYYDYIPVLSLRNIPIQTPINKFLKRAFDIVFSFLVVVFILSWLTPILAIIIRLESKGPIFFKQSRNGFNYKEFDCYKFRSMTPNENAHMEQATKGDMRITKVGAFIRKTSIDELPQFFNVLFGDMSVVGPRPHMVSHTNMYARKVDKFMVRHFVKPGITGLAQTSGFRGEIETNKDIVNRVKYDIFYIENWSLLLDIKIVVQTFLNAVKGEEKAY
ncbi:undecaprenyl-phosphate glucose phosphotransferase [Aestuariibaculum sediminum]|uniref:Undecaprenyl-phosphate glucose phosphotransferase n=1 Tax=Aestuariibaculum sediminum TaxID=2770637 RepID=A0A8J6Q9R6_9FLAO|nr:undecaprenyl-phosphate glucose phosphotransferase [Aestuariibaculum sediminum]MBD0831201.1 undecaprenyl-phosphate glucose phosphotransferase [Aestuariibaculum sediminum]